MATIKCPYCRREFVYPPVFKRPVTVSWQELLLARNAGCVVVTHPLNPNPEQLKAQNFILSSLDHIGAIGGMGLQAPDASNYNYFQAIWVGKSFLPELKELIKPYPDWKIFE